MGRLLRDRRNVVKQTKRTQTRSSLPGNEAKTSKRRHALSDKTNRSENDSSEKKKLPLPLAEVKSCSRSDKSSGSENDSPANGVMARRKAKIPIHALADKIFGSDSDSPEKLCNYGNRAKRNALADKTNNSSESDTSVKCIPSGKKVKIQDSILQADKIKDFESASSPKKSTVMALRQRKNRRTSAENSLHTKLSQENESFNHKEIIASRVPSTSNKRTHTCLNPSSGNKMVRRSFVQLENISEMLEKSNDTDNNKSAKKPIYQTSVDEKDFKICTEMLPEEKIKLYEYEVDANSPKTVAVKRKRKPRKKKVKIANNSDFSDEENFPVRLVEKRLCTSSTSMPSSRKNNAVEKSGSISVHPIQSGDQTSRVLKVVLSPIKSPNVPAASTPMIVNFADNFPSANSMPNILGHVKESLPLKALRFSGKGISSPIVKINPGRQIMKSIYINPTEMLKQNFNPDASVATNSTLNISVHGKESLPLKALRFSEKEISSPVVKINPGRQIKKSIYINPTEILEQILSPDVSIASEENTAENSTNVETSPSQSLKQTKINSFFSTSARSGNISTNDVSDQNSRGIFEELPSRINSESMSTTAASPASQFITMRRKAMYHPTPRISGFERTQRPEKTIKKMTIENCFGFDDDNDAEDNFVPPSVQYRSLPLSVSLRAVCSTPMPALQPTRNCSQAMTQPLPKKKLVTPPLHVLKRPVPPAASEPLIPSTSEYNSWSPPLILSDPETLTPVTFGDEPSNFCKPARRSYQRTPRPKLNYAEPTSEEDEPLAIAKKPKKKGKQYMKKQKQEVENWATSINRQFEEIEDTDLVVE